MSTDLVGATSDAPQNVLAPVPAASAGAPVIIESPVRTLLQRIGGWFTRFFVRFGLLYLFFFLLGRVAGLVPGFGWLGARSFRWWGQMTPWFGRNVLQLTQTLRFTNTGSGDKLWDWVQCTAMLACALAGALIWVWFDRRRRGDHIVHEVLRIGLRYSLGVIMLSYGISKVLYQQMPAPYAARLLEPYGESSPMGLLWTFMGQSWAYSAFAGGLEALGGLLLFWRRTTTLGALLLIAVMANVVLMNFAFDVPVKLYSAQYLIFAVVLAAPDLRRLFDLLVLHRPTVPTSIAFPWLSGRPARLLVVAKHVMVLGILWNGSGQRVWTWLDRPAPTSSPLYGLYDVVTFKWNGQVLPPSLTETRRWRRVIIDDHQVAVLLMSDGRPAYGWRRGPGPDHFTLQTFARGGSRQSVFTYKLTDANAHLHLEGMLDGAALVVDLRRSDPDKMRLRSRGFHWISESPYNR